MDYLTVLRNERKYIITYSQYLSLLNKLDSVLKRDENSKDGSYLVRSVYFDSINNIDLNTKLAGTYIRKKIRLRIYNTKDKKCKLEMKKKQGELQKKISVWISKNDAEELILGNFSVLLNYVESSNKEVLQIYKTLVLGCYRPVATIEYDRIAFMYPNYNTRITFDFNVRSNESNFDIFNDNLLFTPVISDNVILEIKYNEKLMGFISEILKNYKLVNLSVSKYCAGRKQLVDFLY